MKFVKVKEVITKKDKYSLSSCPILKVCIKDGGVYVYYVYDLNPSYGSRVEHVIFYPLEQIEEISFEEKDII